MNTPPLTRRLQFSLRSLFWFLTVVAVVLGTPMLLSGLDPSLLILLIYGKFVAGAYLFFYSMGTIIAWLDKATRDDENTAARVE